MSPVKRVEHALESSLLALGAVYASVKELQDKRTTGDKTLIGLVQQAITACQDALHDPDDDEED